MKAKQILFLAIIVIALIFILQNTQTVEIRLLFWKITAVRAVVLAFTFLTGLVAGMLMDLLWKKKLGLKKQ